MSITRELKAADFGVKASFRKLNGTLRVEGNVATVTVQYIEGVLGDPWAALKALKETAKSAGANALRIEGTVADAQVMRALRRLLGPASQGGLGGPQDVWDLIL